MSNDQKSQGPAIFRTIKTMMEHNSSSTKAFSTSKYNQLMGQVRELVGQMVRYAERNSPPVPLYRRIGVLAISDYVSVIINFNIMSFEFVVDYKSSYEDFEAKWLARVPRLHSLMDRMTDAFNEEKYSAVKELMSTVLTEYFEEFNRRAQAPDMLFDWLVGFMNADLLRHVCSVWKKCCEEDDDYMHADEKFLASRALRRTTRTDRIPLDMYEFARSYDVELPGAENLDRRVEASVSEHVIPDLAKLVASFIVVK
jgi:hypothetical protein